MKLNNQNKIIIGIVLVVIACLQLGKLGIFPFYLIAYFPVVVYFPVAIFGFSWYFMIITPMYYLGLYPHSNFPIAYGIFCALAWISILTILILTRKISLKKRLICLYVIPSLIMGMAFMIRPPFH